MHEILDKDTTARSQTQGAAANYASDMLGRSVELDSLTDLPNRQSSLSQFKYAIAIARRSGKRLATLFVNLNNFKRINDTLGHAVGDQVLRLVAKRLATAVRESDIVSRHGGDEFLVLLFDVATAADVAQVAVKLIAAIGRSARVGEHLLQLTVSIGISLYPMHGEDMVTLIQRADAAMHLAKHGGGGFVFHKNAAGEHEAADVPAAAAHRPMFSQYRIARTEEARRHGRLLDANQQLVLAALGAQKLQEEAERAHQRQTSFLAVVAHELRNPLVPMRQATTLLDMARSDETLLPRIQTIIERQVAHMARLVGDLMDVSRVSTGKLRLECELLDLMDPINAAVSACRPGMDARLQHFTAQIGADAPLYFGDAVRLTQIFSNLLDNASKYSKQSSQIELSVVQSQSCFVITVRDTGIGMSAEMLATVFEPFVQDRAAVVFNGAGLGIGLTVVRELVTAHGGSIAAASDGPGLGSQFVVTLPMAGAPVQAEIVKA